MIGAPVTTADATAFWQGRRSADDLLRAWGSTAQPHRRALIEQLHLFPAFHSLLELGCGPGTNLRLVHDAFPWVTLSGVDVDPATAQFANLRLANGSTAQIRCRDVLVDAPTWAPRSVDVVLSCYSLAYIAPADLPALLAQAVVAARVGLLLVEPQGGAQWGTPVRLLAELGFPEWQHDYVAAVTAAARAAGRNAKVWGAKLPMLVDRCNGAFACVFTS